MFRCMSWWFRYRLLCLKPGQRVTIYFPDRTCPAEVYKAEWIAPRYSIDSSVNMVFTGGWQLQLWFDPEPFGRERILSGTVNKVQSGKYIVELPAGDGRLFGLVNQCRDYNGIHIERNRINQ